MDPYTRPSFTSLLFSTNIPSELISFRRCPKMIRGRNSGYVPAGYPRIPHRAGYPTEVEIEHRGYPTEVEIAGIEKRRDNLYLQATQRRGVRQLCTMLHARPVLSKV